MTGGSVAAAIRFSVTALRSASARDRVLARAFLACTLPGGASQSNKLLVAAGIVGDGCRAGAFGGGVRDRSGCVGR